MIRKNLQSLQKFKNLLKEETEVLSRYIEFSKVKCVRIVTTLCNKYLYVMFVSESCHFCCGYELTKIVFTKFVTKELLPTTTHFVYGNTLISFASMKKGFQWQRA